MGQADLSINYPSEFALPKVARFSPSLATVWCNAKTKIMNKKYIYASHVFVI
jgi:hypothetical protein